MYLHQGPEVGGQFGPYYQSQRLDHYQQNIQLLIQVWVQYCCSTKFCCLW